MIKIDDLIPFLKEGWVAMDENGAWYWFENEPHIESSITDGYWYSNSCEVVSSIFDIAPADDWEKSLIKVGGK